MKRIYTRLTGIILALSMVGGVQAAGIGTAVKNKEEASKIVTSYTQKNDKVQIQVDFDKSGYTVDTQINMKVTVTNLSENTIIFVKGSGSNRIPEALKLQLGGLAGNFYPLAMTMDYQMDMIESGKSKVYECPFVPYFAKNGDQKFGVDKELSFFQSEDFTPAKPGVVKGDVMFTYVEAPGESMAEIFGAFDKYPQEELSMDFSTQIVQKQSAPQITARPWQK